MDYLLLLGAVGLGDGKADTYAVTRPTTVGEDDALDAMEPNGEWSQFLDEKVLLRILPFGWRFEGEETAHGFEPFGLGEVIVQEPEAERAKTRFFDTEQDLLGTSGEGGSELWKRAGQLESLTQQLSEALLQFRVRCAELVERGFQASDKGMELPAG